MSRAVSRFRNISESVVAKLISENVVALSASVSTCDIVEDAPYPIRLYTESVRGAACQGIDIRSRCADKDGCSLQFSVTDTRLNETQAHEAFITYDPVTRAITLRYNGSKILGMLGVEPSSELLVLDSSTTISTGRPDSACADFTSVGNSGLIQFGWKFPDATSSTADSTSNLSH